MPGYPNVPAHGHGHHHHHHHQQPRHQDCSFVSVAQIAGDWGDVNIPGDRVTIVQAGDKCTMTNPKQSWSPATAIVQGNGEIMFTSGIVGLTARLDPVTQALNLSNNSKWARVAAVTSVAGDWGDVTMPGDRCIIQQNGIYLTITNAKTHWSPAQATIDTQNKLTFTSGLPGITADFDGANMMTLSNGSRWGRVGAAPAHVHPTQPTYPPQQQNIPQLAGDWGDASLPNDHLTILQAGDKYTITNAGQSWSPATAIAQNGEIVFTSGILGLKATFDPMSQALNLSNNTKWVRRAPQAASRAPVPSMPVGALPQLGGKWGDVALPGDEVVIVQTGNVLQITNRGQSWSPATGTVDVHNNVVFTSGLPGGLTAVHDGQAKVLRLSNGTTWNRHGGAHAGHAHGHHHHHHAHGHAQRGPGHHPNVQQIGGNWQDPRLPGDHVVINQQGELMTITNAQQSWSPATGKIDAHNRIVFNSGLPAGLTAQLDVPSQTLHLSNGTQWTRKMF